MIVTKYCFDNNSNNITEKFNTEKLEIENADDKIKEILKKMTDFSTNNLIKMTHVPCANMRESTSLSTSTLPLFDSNKSNKKFFAISVCCSSCYCEIIKENSIFHYEYNEDLDVYYLVKNNEVVQIIKGFDTENECSQHVKDNNDLYFPLISYERVLNQICKDY